MDVEQRGFVSASLWCLAALAEGLESSVDSSEARVRVASQISRGSQALKRQDYGQGRLSSDSLAASLKSQKIGRFLLFGRGNSSGGNSLLKRRTGDRIGCGMPVFSSNGTPGVATGFPRFSAHHLSPGKLEQKVYVEDTDSDVNALAVHTLRIGQVDGILGAKTVIGTCNQPFAG